MTVFRVYVMMFFIYISCGLTIAQTAVGFPEMMDELVTELSEAQVSSRTLRLAVMPLSVAGADPTILNDKFGSYFTEALTGQLARESDRFKLYERSRLDALLKEASLTQSGLMDKNAALRIGELAPIDLILSGTYTTLTKTIAIHMRLIDVVSGEILLTFQRDVFIDDDLKMLLRPSATSEKKDPCLEKQEYLKSLLNDLSTTEKVERIVVFARNIPFDMECGKIHFTLINAFKRYNIESGSYHMFLLKTLSGIAYPANDERASAILQYLGKDGEINDEEWEVGIASIARVGNRYLSSYLRYLLLPYKTDPDEQKVVQRSAYFLKEALDGKIGLPVPVSFNFAFFELMDAFNYVYAKDNRYILPVFLSFSDKLRMDEQAIPKVHSLLSKLYWRETDSQKRSELLERLIRHFHERSMDEDAAEDLYDFVKDLEVRGTGNYARDNEIPAPTGHRAEFINHCKELFCEGLKISKFRSQIEDRQDFCLMNDIPCPGVIPTVEECIAMLESAEWAEQDRAAEILSRMGEKAAKAENKLVSILEKSGVSDDRYSRKIREKAIVTLGNLKTKNPRAINTLCESLSSTEYKIPDFASNALVNIGSAAVSALTDRLFDKFGSVQYKAAVILGRIGNDARGALPSLKKVIETTNNSAVHSAAKQAVRLIEESGS
jgi:hypothetical protein